MEITRETLEVDVLVVGGGPAGLAAALHLKRRLAATPAGAEAGVALIEKGGEFGDHSLSGAVMDPRGLAELVPDFRARGCPLEGEVREDAMFYLRGENAHRVPFTPPGMANHGNWIVSLNRLCAWLGRECEAAGVDLFSGFSGQELLYEGTRVVGVRTGEKGLDKDGKPKGNFEPGVDIRAKVTILCDGVRGNLTKELISRLRLDEGKNPQIYATGAKEIWELPPERTGSGRVYHTLGFPLDGRTYGGGWFYDLSEGRASIGFVVGLDSGDPYTDSHRLLQEWKTHRYVREKLAGGKLLRYGAKAIPEGGYWALPRPFADGVLLAGDAGGYLNGQRLKGIHLALKTGMLAAEVAHEALEKDDSSAALLSGYERRLQASWVHEELYGCRNFRQSFQGGLVRGALEYGLQMMTGGRGTKHRRPARPDHEHLGRPRGAAPAAVTDDPETLRFAKLTSVYHSGTKHEENQPSHLHVADPDICRTRCSTEFGNPCEHFCPASVYHLVPDEVRGGKRLQVDFTNCVHCKTCDILDPYQIITWVPPQGGEGPVYTGL